MGGTLAGAPTSGLPTRPAHTFPTRCDLRRLGSQGRGKSTPSFARRSDDVDVGVVRSIRRCRDRIGLAERARVRRQCARLPVALVVLLDPAAIVGNLHDAYRDPGFREARYAVLMTGPSATADIEGVLIRGAQGIRTLTVIPMAAPGAGTNDNERRTA
jgi:hypothetical protein